MAADKISDLIDDKLFDDFQKLNQQLDDNTAKFLAAIDAANKYNSELSKAGNLAEFAKASQQAQDALVNLNAAEQNLIPSQQAVNKSLQDIIAATKARAAADTDAAKVLQQVGGSLDANIKLLVQQKQQLADVTAAQKELSKQGSFSAQSQAQLTAKQAELTRQSLELKGAISANSLVIRQQIKDQQSATSSNDQLTARLNLLRKAYNSLSVEEQQNAQIGGVLLKNIEDLSAKTTKANEAQGKYNDSVGNYENAIKRAISAYVPFGNQIVKSIDLTKSATKETDGNTSALGALAGEFGAFTIGAFAVAMASASYYLSQFKGTANETQKFLAGLKTNFAKFGEGIVETFKDPKQAFLDLTRRAALPGFGLSGNAQEGSDIEQAKITAQNLREITSQQVADLQAQADQYRAQAKNVGLSTQQKLDYIKKAQDIETQVVNKQKENADKQIDIAIQVSRKFGSINKDDVKALKDGNIQKANELANSNKITAEGYNLYVAALSDRTQALNAANMKLIRQQNDEARIEKKGQKEMAQDALFELQKKLEGEKLTAKLILDDDKQSYDARYAALKIYYARSRDLIENERTTVNSTPGISNAKVRGNNQDAKNKLMQLKDEELKTNKSLQEKLNKDAEDNYKQQLEALKGLERQKLEEIQNATAARLQESDNNRLEEETALNNQYNKDEIGYEEYQRQLTKIADKYALERLNIALDGAKKTLITDSAQLAVGAGDPKKAEADAAKVVSLEHQVSNEISKIKVKDAKTDEQRREYKKQQLLDDFNNTLQLAQQFSELYVQNVENRLKRQSDLLDEQTQLEKDQVTNSVGTQTDKNRRLMAIDLQAAAQKKELQNEENKAKHKAAVVEKAANLASGAANIALSILKTGEELGYPAAIPFQVLAGTVGAAQLALIAAQPIPAYEKGTEFAKGGLSIWGEKGRELGITPDGRMIMSPDKATMANIPRGTRIFTAAETARIMARPELNAAINNHQTVDNSEVVTALREVNTSVRLLNVQQRARGVRQNGNWNTYLQRNGLN